MSSFTANVVAIALAAGLGHPVLAQTSPAPAPPEKPAPLVLTGCVSGSNPGTITVQDSKKGIFELFGRGLDVYVGKRVELRGNAAGLHLTTGLYPTPNVAAQAGAIDPVQAAQAAMPGGAAHGTGVEPLPRFDVMKVRTVKGECK